MVIVASLFLCYTQGHRQWIYNLACIGHQAPVHSKNTIRKCLYNNVMQVRILLGGSFGQNVDLFGKLIVDLFTKVWTFFTK